MRPLELLIPARNLDAGMAGVDHGADAVYIGGPGFGARSAAANPVGQIAKLVDYAHPYGVKVYAALNTLTYEDELRRAEAQARELISAGVDALIIQDTAFLMMRLRGVAFHASTQMTNTTVEHVRFLGKAGVSRAVLERGLTLDEISRITAGAGIETECFIHGAICVGHSGKCYLSRSMGPRSGNRGVCGQPCRMKWDLTDGEGKITVGGKHLLSVRDLNLSDHIGRLIDAGVVSFKVEGRLKDTEYVKNITAFYRERLDRQIAQREGYTRSSDGSSNYGFTPDPAKSFSRGFTLWTAEGTTAGSGSPDTPKSLGEPVGSVTYTGDGYFRLDDENHDVRPGDGICFMTGSGLSGTNVNIVEGSAIYPDKPTLPRPGTQVYRNYDHRFQAALAGSKTRRTIPVEIVYDVRGGSLEVTATDQSGNRAAAVAEGDWEMARDGRKMKATLEGQLAKSGETIFEVTSVSPRREPSQMPFIPLSVVNALRREVLEKLRAVRLEVFARKRQEQIGAVVRDDYFAYYLSELGGEANVTNSLARKFWTMHGVEKTEPPMELRDSLGGQVVMTTPYCIRRELGRCLKEKKENPSGELYLQSGSFRYRLGFDCNTCIMTLTKWPQKDE
ncbi:MAG: U32 family peptidase [Alistipes sp.]|nr:U32 family peptidase [Alistipes sp.]